MRKRAFILAGLALVMPLVLAEDPVSLPIGAALPDFSLQGVDGVTYSPESFKESKILMLVFTANHYPTAQAYEERMKALASAYTPGDMQLVAVSSNHPEAVCLEELGYSDLGDTYEEMKVRARDAGYNFPYLYDGEDQALATACGAKATPHVFIFDGERKLRYRGRIDEMENPYEMAKRHDARNAIDALLAGKDVPVETTKAFGCSMKWRSKMEWRRTLDARWAEKAVSLEVIDTDGVGALLRNEGEDFRLINIWATWCGPCVIEFPEFVDMQRMYGNRDFQVVSLSLDQENRREKAREFLEENQAAFPNYIFSDGDREALINLVDPDWEGNIPYTLLLAPGGKVVYRHDGIIDPLEVRRAVVGELGRYFADD
jgi:thiol-disulfide isomerase/thioredoxin